MLLLFYFISIDVSWFIVFQTNHADYLVNQKKSSRRMYNPIHLRLEGSPHRVSVGFHFSRLTENYELCIMHYELRIIFPFLPALPYDASHQH